MNEFEQKVLAYLAHQSEAVSAIAHDLLGEEKMRQLHPIMDADLIQKLDAISRNWEQYHRTRAMLEE